MIESDKDKPPDEVVGRDDAGAPRMMLALTAIVLVAVAGFWVVGTQAAPERQTVTAQAVTDGQAAQGNLRASVDP